LLTARDLKAGGKALFPAFFPLILALIFHFFVQICTKNLRNLYFFPRDFQKNPWGESCPGFVFFWGASFFLPIQEIFPPKKFEFIQLFLQK